MTKSESSDLSSSLSIIMDAAAVIDGDGRIVQANESFEKLVLGKKGRSAKNYPVASLGTETQDGYRLALDGRFTEAHTFIQDEDNLCDWRVSLIPFMRGTVLIILSSRAGDLAFHDALTGLPNRRVANERLEREYERWMRNKKSPFSVALADIDLFKSVNDTYGHETGDQVLQMVSEMFGKSLRAGDWVARWGGEEFLFFFHETDDKKALKVAERCRKQVCAQPFKGRSGIEIGVTVSIGVTSVISKPDDLKTDFIERLISDADILLYDAKHEGRNCCVGSLNNDRLNWMPEEIVEVINSDKLVARRNVVSDKKSKIKGALYLPIVNDMGPRAAQHLFNAALRSNIIDKMETKWLEVVAEATKDYRDEDICLVPLNHFMVENIEKFPAIEQGIIDLQKKVKNLVLTTKHEFATHSNLQFQQQIAKYGAHYCPSLPELPDSAGLISILKPKYIMARNINPNRKDVLAAIFDLLASFETTLILPSSVREDDNYPHSLYVN